MSNNDPNAFTPISNPIERKAAFGDLVGQTSFITGIATAASSTSTILLRVVRVEELRQLLFMDVIEESPLLPGGTVYRFSFHIQSGQFQFEAALKREGKSPFIELNGVALQRMQRRTNFRMSTGQLNVVFRPHKPLASGKLVPEWHVLDVSVGGFSFAVSPTDASSLQMDQHVDGTLKMQGRADLKVKAVIRHIDKMEHGTNQAVGLEILDMDQAMQRDLLSMSLQIHRETKHQP